MAEILFLSHRIPYPPDKGDKIRSWNLLRHLSARHTVSLGCFVDDPDDLRHRAVLEGTVAEANFCSIPRSPLRVRNLGAFWNRTPISVYHYRSRQMERWVRDIFRRRKIDAVFVFSSNVAQYALATDQDRCRRIIDFADVDSDKWRQYAERGPWPQRLIYRRESHTLAAHDRRVACAFDISIFVSRNEAEMFSTLAPDCRHKLAVLPNGIDADFFEPAAVHASPFRHGEKPIVFTGAMDYWANVDAVEWFADAVYPVIRSDHPDATFWIVGAKPTKPVLRLQKKAGIKVTGRVPDVRPFLSHAAVVVAPLRVARGIQNKVLEGMSMARPVVVTPAAVAGLDEVSPGEEVEVAEGAPAMAAAVGKFIGDPSRSRLFGERARARVVSSYSWPAMLAVLDQALDCGVVSRQSSQAESGVP